MRVWQSNVFRWSVWWLLLTLMTWALLSPQPPKAAAALLPGEMTFTASKAVHVCAYAFMTLLVLWLNVVVRDRLLLWSVLAAHAALTEYGQTFVPGRYGSWSDVFINWAGLSLGLALAFGLSRRRRATPSSTATAQPT